MNQPKVTPVDGTPINRLFFAINHYISTGEHIGVGVANDMPDGKQMFTIVVNLSLPRDVEDFACFRSRYEELRIPFGLRLPHMGVHGHMEAFGLVVPKDRVDELAVALMERPGPKGWGSLKEIIDSRTWFPNAPYEPWKGLI